MRRMAITLIAMIMLLGLSVSAQATLEDMGDGTVYDTTTQLSWLKNANVREIMTYREAVAWAESLNNSGGYAGLSGWRLPATVDPDTTCGGKGSPHCTGSEMGFLFSVSLGNTFYGMSKTGPFTNVKTVYWSGTVDAALPDYAWTFNFLNGLQTTAYNPSLHYAWAVRAGARTLRKGGSTATAARAPSKEVEDVIISPPSTLKDMGDGTVYDTATQLSWLKNANAREMMTYRDAVAWAESLNNSGGYAGLSGWRLPATVDPDTTCGGRGPSHCIGSEMGFLYYISLGNTFYGLAKTGPFTNVQTFEYWSGTVDYSTHVWTFNFLNGYQRSTDETSFHYAWPVRAGARTLREGGSTATAAPAPKKEVEYVIISPPPQQEGPKVYTNDDLKKYSRVASNNKGWEDWAGTQPVSSEPDAHAIRVNDAMREATSYKIPEKTHVLDLLRGGKYDELEQIFAAKEKEYQRHHMAEYSYFTMYRFFDSADKNLIVFLDRWVKEKKSYIAYAARGCYKVKRGSLSRGTRYASETSNEQMEGMDRYFSEAKEDLQKALALNRQLVFANERLIVIAKVLGDRQLADKMMADAIKTDPFTYYIRVTYMENLQPRWGGSYEEMERFAKDSLQYLSGDPRLWTLQGEVYADKGDMYQIETNYDKSLDALTQALRYGDRGAWLKKRGHVYESKHRFLTALKDFEKVLSYWPDDEDAKREAKYLGDFCKPYRLEVAPECK